MVSKADAVHKRTILSQARGVAEVFSSVRKVYSEHRNQDGPLPIIFARDLADQITSADVSIYSPYPFPTNPGGGLHNRFQREAWFRLAERGDSEFISWESDVLRYAVPDVMTVTCVECHNTVLDTPKSDWKIGDVRGVIEILLPY